MPLPGARANWVPCGDVWAVIAGAVACDEPQSNGKVLAVRANSGVYIGGLGVREGAEACVALADHVPNDGQVGAQDAAERFEDGIGAERHVVPGEVRVATAEDDGEPDGRNNTCSQAEAKDETEHQLLLGLQLQVPDHGHGQQKYDDVRGEVEDVGEVGKGDNV